MNALMKRYFIIPFFAFTLLTFLFASYQLFKAFSVGWIFPAIASLSALVLFAKLFLSKQPRNDSIANILLGVGVTATVCSLFSNLTLALILSALVTIGFALYLFWYTPVNRSQSNIEVGKKIPAAQFLNQNGEYISTTDQGKSVWMFVRGNWCPLCVAQVEELSKEYKKLSELNTNIFIVTAQSQEQSAKLAKKFDVPMNFLTDPNVAGSKALGIEHINGVGLGILGYEADTILPTVIITDENGIVLFADQTDNYRVRPEPELFINVLENNS